MSNNLALAAMALFEDWKSTDSEVKLEWDTAPEPLRNVFLRKAEIVAAVLKEA